MKEETKSGLTYNKVTKSLTVLDNQLHALVREIYVTETKLFEGEQVDPVHLETLYKRYHRLIERKDVYQTLRRGIPWD